MRILVIEDDPTVGQYVKRGLEEQRYAVDLVPDGDEGERRASSEAYDLVILDMRLPKKPGLDVLNSLRAKGFEILEVSTEDPGNVLPDAAPVEPLDGLFDVRQVDVSPERKVQLALDLDTRQRLLRRMGNGAAGAGLSLVMQGCTA